MADMDSVRACATLIVALTLCPAASAAPTPRDVRGAGLLVRAYADDHHAPGADVTPVRDPALARSFPGHLFFTLRFPYTAADKLPKPFQPTNVAAVDLDGKVHLLASPRDVEKLFEAGF